MAKKPVQKKPATPIIPIAGAIVKALVKSGIAKKVAQSAAKKVVQSAVVKALAKPRFFVPKTTPKATGKPGGAAPRIPAQAKLTPKQAADKADMIARRNIERGYAPKNKPPKKPDTRGPGEAHFLGEERSFRQYQPPERANPRRGRYDR